MTWTYENQEVSNAPEGFVAFVYLITNLENNRKYVGKKRLKFKRTKQVNKKKKKIMVDSDWKEYYGSNKELLEDIEKIGKKHFKREILYWCKTLGTSSYLEAKEQFTRSVLESDDYYNGWITCRVASSHLKL